MKPFLIFLTLGLWLVIGQAWSTEDWYWKGSGQLLLKNYSGSSQRNNLSGVGVFLSGDYLERGGFMVGYNVNHTDYKSGLSNAPVEIDEDILFLSGRVNYHPDQLPGKLTFRIDSYIGNNAINYRTTTFTPGPMGGSSSHQLATVKDKFVVMNPIVSFLNYAKTFYVDLGYAYSSYNSDDNSTDDIGVSQWTPTLGFGFNRAYDWLQLRAYLVSFSSSNRVTGKNATSAIEAKWTHWFSTDAPLNLHSARLTVLTGERLYGVDSDTCSLCNVPDLQTGMVAIGAEWKISEQGNVLLLGGYETYENLLLNDQYSSNYIYVYMSQNW